MRVSSYSGTLLFAAVGLACQATVHVGEVTDTSSKSSESGTGEETESGDASGANTAGSETTGLNTTEPDTTGPSTSEAGTTGGTTGGETTGLDTTGLSTSDTTTGEGTTETEGTTGTTGGVAELDDWTRYREVLIDNAVPTELADFRVLVEVEYDSDMSGDWSDLRFTDASGTVLLPHWLEWDNGPALAFVWVRVPAIAADDITTIRMYYGNPEATSASNGFDTFLFFDDFEAGQLDGATWKSTAPVTLESGRLKITHGAVYSTKKVSGFPNTTVEARVQWGPGNNLQYSKIGVGQGQTSVANQYFVHFGDGTQLWDGEQFFVPQNEAEGNTSSMSIWGISVDETHLYPTQNRYEQPPLQVGLDFDFYMTLGGLNGKLAELTDVVDLDVDWVLTRRYAKPMPTTIIGGEKSP